MDDSCLCGEGAETFLQLQLACKLKSRNAGRPGAHDHEMRVLEEEVKREAPPGRRGVWDTRDVTCAHRHFQSRREILVKKWKGQLGGPEMYAEPAPRDAKQVDKNDNAGHRRNTGRPKPKLGQKGHGDRSGKPKAQWIDIGHGGEDDIHYRRCAM